MAKPSTADTTTTAPAKAVAAAPSAKSAHVPSVEYEGQRAPGELLTQATNIFGDDPPEERVTPAKEAAKKEPESKPDKELKGKEAPAKSKPEDEEEKPEKDDSPLIPDEDEEDDAKAKDDESRSELEKERFEKRELKRKLKEEVKALEAKNAELEKRVKEVTSGGSAAPEAEGAYKGVKTPDEVDTVAKRLEAWEAYYEDHEDGVIDEKTGDEVISKQDVKKELRAIRAELKKAPDIKKAFAALEERKETANAKAKKLFPWASDPDHKHNAIVLDLAKHHPEVAKAPDSAYALGLMTIGKLVEGGKYKLVLASAPTKKADEPAPKPAQRQAMAPKPTAKAMEEEEDHAGFDSRSTAALSRALSVFE